MYSDSFIIDASNSSMSLVSIKLKDSILPETRIVNMGPDKLRELLKSKGFKEIDFINKREFILKPLSEIAEKHNRKYEDKQINSFEDIEKELRPINEWSKEWEKYLNQIRSIDIVEYNDDGIIKTYTPRILITEETNASIKIPYYLIDRVTNEKIWDYDYLLFPLNTFRGELTWNKKLIDLFDSRFGFRFEYTDVKNKVGLITHGFSPNWYEYYRELLVAQTIRTRAIINIIRDLGFYHNIEDDYFAIYQESRMAKNDKMDYIKINYKNNIKEVSFNSVLNNYIGYDKSKFIETLDNMTYEELDDLIADIDLSIKNILESDGNSITIASLEAIKLYINNIRETSGTLFKLYKELEFEREEIRRNIFYFNILIIMNNENLDDMFKYYLNRVKEGPSNYSYKMNRNKNIEIKIDVVKKIVDIIDNNHDFQKDNYNLENRKEYLNMIWEDKNE